MSSVSGPSSAARNQPSANELSALQRAIAALEKMKARLDAVERAANEPLAVVGMGCRFPGGGEGPEAFWQVLTNGIDAVREIPPSRWPSSDIPGERPGARWAALLDDLAKFDAAFFGISPREAESLDPQQRMLLEVTWEAIEDAGLRSEDLLGSRTGVFLGICSSDYHILVGESRVGQYDAYCSTGNLFSTAAGRLSFTLGFQGPAISIDTACSSSLVAVAQAAQSLRTGDCDLAVVGGVNAVLAPRTMAMLLETQALSPDGRCKTLDARANGFVRGEGCGLLILKRLSDAIRDGDRIRGLIRGWAVNQDGRSTGLTTPNVLSQQAMLRQALERAKLSPADIGYVEMHGTGTSLGDPIEAEALREVLGAPRLDNSSCVLGGVKTNIGHLEGAAGVAGLIKILLAFEHGSIPRNLHFRRLNPRISLDDTPFVIPKEHVAWPRGEKTRRAGVSSFGLSGTNAHVILEEPPVDTKLATTKAAAYLLPISAKSPDALNALAQSFSGWMSGEIEATLDDVIYTASARRTHHEHRLAAVAQTRDEFAAALGSFARGAAQSGIIRGRAKANGAPRIVFVFSGQGSQWVGMGAALIEEPVFRAKVEEIDALVQQHASFSVLQELLAPENEARLDETEIAQAAIFCMQVGLAELFKSLGIMPSAVVGHSVGEISAAHVSGALSLEQAVRLVVLRGRIMQRATGNGKMAWAAMDAQEASRVLSGRLDKLSIAAVNDPTSVVLSGETAALENLISELTARGIATRPLRVNYAFHSPQMEPLAQLLVNELGPVETRACTTPIYSTVRGDRIEPHELDIAYWGKNVRASVNLADAVAATLRDGHDILLEIGPHPVLAANLEQCVVVSKVDARVVPTLRRQGQGRRAILEAVGALYTRGYEIDWKKLHPADGRVVSLPAYAWQRERFWIERPRQTATAAGKDVHPLLGIRFDSSIAPGEHVWQQWLSVAAFPYLADHRLLGEVVFPGVGYAEMAIAATAAVYGSGIVVIEEMALDHMLTLDAQAERQVQAVLQQDEEGISGIAISSRGEGESTWTRHVTVRSRVEAALPLEYEPIRTIENRCTSTVESAAHYASMDARGLTYSSSFRGVQHVRVGEDEALGYVSLSPNTKLADYYVHPALLDACLQAATWAIASRVSDVPIVPKAFLGLRYYGRPSHQAWVHGRFLGVTEDGSLSIGIIVYNEAGQAIIEIQELRITRVEAQPRIGADPLDDLLLDLNWQKKDLPPAITSGTASAGAWLIVGDAQGMSPALAGLLRERGETCVEAFADTTYARLPSGEYRLDPTDANHIRKLLNEAFGPHRVCKGIVHSLSLNSTPWETTTADTLSVDVRQSCLSALRVTQALLTHGWRDVPRLFLVTRGVYSIESCDTAISVAQAPIWGLGRTIALEHPALECTRLDLSPVASIDETRAIVRELLAGDGEDQIALRSSGRFVARLARSTIETFPLREFAFRSDRTYLITGGLGGLGLELAKWMFEEGARHFVLIGRSAPNPQAAEAVKTMQQAGANVYVASADVSQREALAGVLDVQKRDMPPLAGIVHAAAVLDDRTLLELSEDSLLRVMGAKVMGGLHLHTLTAGQDLDFFVLYSSAASVLGSPGQGNYAAANAFLDALARARVAANLPATSIAWGPFTDVGLAAAQENRGKRLAARGIEGISPATGNAILMKLLAHPRAEVAALKLSVRQWQDFFPQAAGLPLLTDLRAEAASTGSGNGGAQAFRDRLEATEPAERAQFVQTHALEQLGQVLRLDPTRIDSSATFASLGVDSLMSLELRNNLQTSLGLELQATLLFTYPTTDKLVAHIIGKLDLVQTASPTVVVQTAPLPKEKSTHSAEVAELEVDDLMAMLDEELSATKKGS